MKLFYRNTLKLSYSCMPNVKQLIDGHHKAILKNTEIEQQGQDSERKCNCRKKEECPLDGECLVNEVVYHATVKTRKHGDIHRSYSKPGSRQDTETTSGHSRMKREKMRRNSVNTSGS